MASLNAGLLGLVIPPPPSIPGWIEALPELPTPGSPATALLFLLTAGAAIVSGAGRPPKPRKLHYDHEREENQHVVKISDCRTAVEEVLNGREIIGAIIRYFTATSATAYFTDFEGLEAESAAGKAALEPVIDAIVYRIADFALSQLWQRHASKDDYNVRAALRKAKRDRTTEIIREPPLPPGKRGPPRIA